MSHTCFTHSSTDGHLGCFISWLLLIMLQLVKWCLCSFELVFWVCLDIVPEVGLLDQKADPFLIFSGISILLSTEAAPVCISINIAKGFPFLHILTSTCLMIYWWQPFWPYCGFNLLTFILEWFDFSVFIVLPGLYLSSKSIISPIIET